MIENTTTYFLFQTHLWHRLVCIKLDPPGERAGHDPVLLRSHSCKPDAGWRDQSIRAKQTCRDEKHPNGREKPFQSSIRITIAKHLLFLRIISDNDMFILRSECKCDLSEDIRQDGRRKYVIIRQQTSFTRGSPSRATSRSPGNCLSCCLNKPRRKLSSAAARSTCSAPKGWGRMGAVPTRFWWSACRASAGRDCN